MMNVENSIPDMALLLESMNGSYTTESIVTNSRPEWSLSEEHNTLDIKSLTDIYED